MISIPTHSLMKPHGVAIVTDPDSPGETHTDTLRCVHCQRIMMYRKGSGGKLGKCLKCMGPTCDSPQCTSECLHWEKRLDLYEAGKLATL